jgi:iron complex transport system substrate-binding protein
MGDGPLSSAALAPRAAPPRRIVSLTCSNTEIACALGLGSTLVGVDDWSDFPPEVTQLPRVGPDLKIDMTKVAALEPDLILASLSVPGMERNLVGLERLGVPFLVLDPKSLDDVFADVLNIGEATGVLEAGERLVARMRARIRAVAEPVQASTDQPTLYWEWWPKPLISPGRLSWMVQIAELAGAVLSFGDVEAASHVVQDSQVFARDPDCIALCWCGTLQARMDAASVAARPGWDRLKAVRAGHIHCFPEALYGRPGPRLVEGLERLARVMHPHVFETAPASP